MKNNEQMDERQIQITQKAMAFAGIFLGLCVSISMICKVVTAESLGWEFWALLGACLVMLGTRRYLGDVEPPRSILNQFLPVGSGKEDRAARKKDYALQSLLFAGICTVLGVLLVAFGQDETADYELVQLLFPSLSKGVAVAVSAVITFAITFLISYGVDYMVGEHQVRRYNRMLAQLDEEE